MANHRRSYIFGFNKAILIVMMGVIWGVFCIEGIYRSAHAPEDWGELEVGKLANDTSDKILVLGDSRAQRGIAVDVLARAIKNRAIFNLARDAGGIYRQVQLAEGIPGDKALVMCVTPANTFGTFAELPSVPGTSLEKEGEPDSRNQLLGMKFLAFFSPHAYVNSILSRSSRHIFRISYGFRGIYDLLFLGRISQFVSPRGWKSSYLQGAEETFARQVNDLVYKEFLLKPSVDQGSIDLYKAHFSDMIKGLILKKTRIMIIRLPVSDAIQRLENRAFPWFDEFIRTAANEAGILYLSHFPGFSFPKRNTDGSHLPFYAAIEFTELIAADLEKFASSSDEKPPVDPVPGTRFLPH